MVLLQLTPTLCSVIRARNDGVATTCCGTVATRNAATLRHAIVARNVATLRCAVAARNAASPPKFLFLFVFLLDSFKREKRHSFETYFPALLLA